MKTFTAITCSLLATLHFAGAAPFSEDRRDEMLSVLVSYDQRYDVGGTSLNTVACSDGENGLESRFPTFSDLPAFPRIGGAPTSKFTSPVSFLLNTYTLTQLLDGTRRTVAAAMHCITSPAILTKLSMFLPSMPPPAGSTLDFRLSTN